MGYDCTLHVVDEIAIRTRFIPILLGKSDEKTPFDEREDAAELWSIVRRRLDDLSEKKESPGDVAKNVALLAIAWSASEHPYHYERGFCLSMWDQQDEIELYADFPKKLRGNCNELFADLVAERPGLKKKFPSDIEENFCPGVFIPADKVPAALAWVKKKVKKYSRRHQRTVEGLLLVLQAAAERGLAYWEATEAPIPWVELRAPKTPLPAYLEELAWSSGDIEFLSSYGETSALLSRDDTRQMRDSNCVHLMEVEEWPPRVRASLPGLVSSAARSPSGRWVVSSRANESANEGFHAYSLSPGESGFNRLSHAFERPSGIGWVGFVGELLVAALNPWRQDDARGRWIAMHPSIAMNEVGDRLEPCECIPSLVSPPKFGGDLTQGTCELPNCGTASFEGMRDFLCWGNVWWANYTGIIPDYNGFAPRIVIEGLRSDAGLCVLKVDSNYTVICAIDGGRLFAATYGDAPTLEWSPLPNIGYVSGISDGPNESALISHPSEEGPFGRLYFPFEGTYIPIDSKLIPDQDPLTISQLWWLKRPNKLVVVSRDAIWALSMDYLMGLPRYDAQTEKRIR